MTKSDSKGPVESGSWPETLPANVIKDGSSPRARGYDMIEDIARHYDFAESVLVMLGAPPPTPDWGRAVNIALVVLGITSVAEAPVHAATVARRCGSPARVTLGIGMLGLAEQAQDWITRTKRIEDSESKQSAEPTWSLLPASVRAVLKDCPRSRQVLAFEILSAAGLRTETQLVAVFCLSRISSLASEVDAVRRGDLRDYPMRLPDFAYEDRE